ncbi:hypothetical protein ACONUD_14870 [Microbulbifer harenosus]|uniref:EamA domain-containing protein n=1 Tax=Microbulbifer harenosus TaxID=2576840 RepID=A0ABY2UMT9_9GAMM|nr:hypothetical protein [Microbulbifer harenosus]TLM79086.1 hypothetical protein FDY93_02960 [Microbulbifer harenosus]
MPPVAAVSLVFALVLGAVLWIYVLRLSFAESALSGIIAILLPPLALVNILAHRRQDRELVTLTGAVILLICTAVATA